MSDYVSAPASRGLIESVYFEPLSANVASPNENDVSEKSIDAGRPAPDETPPAERPYVESMYLNPGAQSFYPYFQNIKIINAEPISSTALRSAAQPEVSTPTGSVFVDAAEAAYTAALARYEEAKVRYLGASHSSMSSSSSFHDSSTVFYDFSEEASPFPQSNESQKESVYLGMPNMLYYANAPPTGVDTAHDNPKASSTDGDVSHHVVTAIGTALTSLVGADVPSSSQVFSEYQLDALRG